jgi:hypothetical protein
MKPAIWVAGLTGRNGGQLALDGVGFGNGERVAP